MQILNQTVLPTLESSPGIYSISNDYSLNGATLSIPSGKTLYFNGGSISNGTLSLNGTLLNNLEDDSINARIVGTILNTVIYTSQIGGINNLGLSDYSGMTIYCNQDESSVSSTICISGVNANGNTATVFDGMNNSFHCNVPFFKLQNGSQNVTVRNFVATTNTSSDKNFFDTDRDTTKGYSGIHVYNNHITGFTVGISLGNEAENLTVTGTITGNYIFDCLGTTSGKGYGIHLANAYNCWVVGNHITNCERHAIYHAYGSYNTIQYNTISEFRKNLTESAPQAAIDVSRKSSHVTVSYNTFTSCNGVCIMVYTCTPAEDSDGEDNLFRYGNADNIVISNNTFNMGYLTGDLFGLTYIMIGYSTPCHGYSARAAAQTLIMDVVINNNTFNKLQSDSQKCIRIDQCVELSVINNAFNLKLPDSPNPNTHRTIFNFQDTTVPDSVMTATISGNTFSYIGTNPGADIFLIGDDVSLFSSSINSDYIIYWSSNSLQNQYIGSVTNYYLYEGIPGDNLIIS